MGVTVGVVVSDSRCASFVSRNTSSVQRGGGGPYVSVLSLLGCDGTETAWPPGRGGADAAPRAQAAAFRVLAVWCRCIVALFLQCSAHLCE